LCFEYLLGEEEGRGYLGEAANEEVLDMGAAMAVEDSEKNALRVTKKVIFNDRAWRLKKPFE
jgi:hypothetical protein